MLLGLPLLGRLAKTEQDADLFETAARLKAKGWKVKLLQRNGRTIVYGYGKIKEQCRQ